MDGKTAVVVAVIGLLATIGAALIANPSLLSRRPATRLPPTPEIATLTCDPIPPVKDETRPPRPPSGTNYVWVPTDFQLSSTGKLERFGGHWARPKAGGPHRYVPGHWDTSTGR